MIASNISKTVKFKFQNFYEYCNKNTMSKRFYGSNLKGEADLERKQFHYICLQVNFSEDSKSDVFTDQYLKNL